MTHDPDFKGYIHDVGGPTADFRAPACDKQLTKGVCPGRQCLFPPPAPTSGRTTATISASCASSGSCRG